MQFTTTTTTPTNDRNEQDLAKRASLWMSDTVVPFSYPWPDTQEQREEENQVLDRMVPGGTTDAVLLGESTHGTLEFYSLRRELTRQLVRDHGFRAVVFEAEWPDMYGMNQHLTCSNSPYPSVSAALAQHVHGHGKYMWQNAETVTLLEWIRLFNASQGFRPESMVYVFGMDCQQIYRSLHALYTTLAELDSSMFNYVKSRLSFFHGYQENENNYARQTVNGIGSEQIPEILQTILSEFQWKYLEQLKAQLPSNGLDCLALLNVEQNLEVLVNAEEYFRKKILEPAGSNVSWNTRDQHMALTVGRIRERLRGITSSDEGITKVVVWAHNSHIGNAAATVRGGAEFTRNENWNLGQMIRHVVPDRCYSLGLDTYHGTVTALNEGEADGDDTKSYELRHAMENSSEHLCHLVCTNLQCSAFLLPLQPEMIPNSQLLQVLKSPIQQRYVGVHYRPGTEMRSHYYEATLVGQYDALVFVDKTTALPVLGREELHAAHSESEFTATSPPKSSNTYGFRRLLQEYARLGKEPIPKICVQPEPDNAYNCHFIITFDSGVYAGGEYHGLLKIPKNYPMEPPRISFFTPSGRFEVNERICVSFSDYHPELWNPSWGIESVLVGLQSFFQEECPEAIGSIMASTQTRRKLAKESHEFNVKDNMYQQLFGDQNNSIKSTTKIFGEEKKDGEEDGPYCRYCRMSGGELISPCHCLGSNKWTHKECLAKWQYQAILSQSTHRKYQTDTEKFCNVCGTEFQIKWYSREKVMVSFTGAEMANMIAPGCLLVATQKSSIHTLRLIEQYEDLQEKLHHWVNAVFLIAQCRTSPDGKSQHIVGLSLTNEMNVNKEEDQRPFQANWQSEALSELRLPNITRTFIGGPCSPEVPHILFLAQRSKRLENDNMYCWKVLRGKLCPFEGDLCLYYSSSTYGIRQSLAWVGDALIGVHLYWGCATWDRVQLLGEIARGGWGLAPGQIEAWTEPKSNRCWQSTLDRAIFAGANDFSRRYEGQEDSKG